MTARLWRRLVLVGIASALAFSGCAGKPPLPKRASIERMPDAAAPTDFKALVEGADIIYFPSDRAASAGRSEPAALLLAAFAEPIAPRLIGWGSIDATQQQALDDLSGETSRAARETRIRELHLVGSGRAREHCRAVLRDLEREPIRHLALGPPPGLLAKVSTGERLDPDEQVLLPRGYNLPRNGYETWASQLPAARLSESGLANSYRAALVRRQFAAERIAQHAPRDREKLLAFVDSEDLEDDGVPYYVSQKTGARQLVFGREGMERARLLTSRGGGSAGREGRGFEIVDRAPGSARH